MTLRSPMISACQYYLAMTGKNLALHALRGLRSPRNILAIAVAVLFFAIIWFMVSRAKAQANVHDLGATLRGYLSPLHAMSLLFLVEVPFRCGALPFSGGVSSFARVLAFKRSEVEYLFQAPLTRRQIVCFKVAATLVWQTCGAAVAVAAVLALGYPSISFFRSFLGLVLALGAVYMLYMVLHLCASFLASRNLRYLIYVFAAVVVAAFSYAVIQAFAQALALFGGFSRIAETPAFQSLVLPVSFVVAPAASESWLEFLQTLWQPVVVGAGASIVFFTRCFHFSYFEEAFGSREPGAPNRKVTQPFLETGPSLLRLRPTGPQWKAIVWKNLKAIVPRRPAAALVQASLVLLGLVALCLAPLSDGFQVIVSILLFGVVLIALAIGPWLLRSGGLRSDLFYFDMLKSMPISGRQLLFAEVAVQFSILGGVVAIAASILAIRGNGPPIGILPVFLGLVAARVTVHNLFALYFPGLVKLDPVGKENDHRFIVRGAVTVLAMALLLILPLLVAGAIVTLGPAVLSVDRVWLSNIARASIGVLMALELLALIYFSDSRYQKFDISQENTAH